jgi:hypothetical protein
VSAHHQESNDSDNSGEKEDSIADEANLSEEKCKQQELSSTATNLLSDDAQNYLLYQIRIKMSMKRNVLKKSLSEDLTWADFLKNDHHHLGYQRPQVRSIYSTPERRVEVQEESQALAKEETLQVGNAQAQHRGGSARGKKGKGKHHHSTRNSLNQSQTSFNQN